MGLELGLRLMNSILQLNMGSLVQGFAARLALPGRAEAAA